MNPLAIPRKRLMSVVVFGIVNSTIEANLSGSVLNPFLSTKKTKYLSDDPQNSQKHFP